VNQHSISQHQLFPSTQHRYLTIITAPSQLFVHANPKMSIHNCSTPVIADSNDNGGVSLPSIEADQQDTHSEAHHQQPQQQDIPVEAQQQEAQQEDTPDDFEPEPIPVHMTINGVH
jgi:hypothetical protein